MYNLFSFNMASLDLSMEGVFGKNIESSHKSPESSSISGCGSDFLG